LKEVTPGTPRGSTANSYRFTQLNTPVCSSSRDTHRKPSHLTGRALVIKRVFLFFAINTETAHKKIRHTKKARRRSLRACMVNEAPPNRYRFARARRISMMPAAIGADTGNVNGFQISTKRRK